MTLENIGHINYNINYNENFSEKENSQYIVNSFKLFIDKLIQENKIFSQLNFSWNKILHGKYYREMLDYCYQSYNFEDYYFKERFSIQINSVNINSFFDYIGQEEIILIFSLDSYKELHNMVRKNDTWDNIVENILIAKQLDYTIKIVSILHFNMNNNFDKVLDFVIWCSKNNFQLEFKSNNNNENNSELHLYYNLGVLFLKNSLYKFLITTTTKNCSFNGNKCFSLEFFTNGDVYTCYKGIDEDKNNLFANWKEQSFEEIKKLRTHLFQDVYINSKCIKCEYYNMCYGGCPLIRIDGLNKNCQLLKGMFDTAKSLNTFNLMPMIRNHR